jgi:hypothetical protein
MYKSYLLSLLMKRNSIRIEFLVANKYSIHKVRKLDILYAQLTVLTLLFNTTIARIKMDWREPLCPELSFGLGPAAPGFPLELRPPPH